jgi:glycerol-3-phosphate dehydrogenase (NAD(P)+)
VKKEIGVIGAGSWGTTLANLLGEKGLSVALWVFEKDLCERMISKRENDLYLPGVRLSDNLIPTNSLEEAAKNKEVIVSASPSHVVRGVMEGLLPHLVDDTLIVSASKGIESDTLMTMSEVFGNILPEPRKRRLAFISGPSFAREVSNKLPTAVAVASKDWGVAEEVQKIFATHYFRIYTSLDVRGVELGGAAKNVIAIAVGVSDGLGLGSNTRAALITRGLREITRLGVRMGANPLTFSGLSGLGDLILTCTGDLSRNRSVGLKLGRGMKLKEILEGMLMVAEGVRTARAIYRLSQKFNIEMPITEQVFLILYKDKSPKEAVVELMARDLKNEMD